MNQLHETIIQSVSDYYKVDKELITSSKTRKEKVVRARHICQYLIRKELNLELKQIGLLFDRKYPAIIYAIKDVDTQLTNRFDHSVKNDIIKIKEIIKSK